MAVIFNHEHPDYIEKWKDNKQNKYNGAYYYSKEICENIIPLVKTDRNWVTINVEGHCFDSSIVFVHNNKQPELYNWLRDYKDLILVCGVSETCGKVAHLGTPVYLPLSVDVEYVSGFKISKKSKEVAYVGRREKRRGVRFDPPWTSLIENMARPNMLKEMAKYKKVYAVGRCAIEARILGCEVLPYDKRFPDPSIWKVIDNKEAAYMLQELIDGIDKRRNEN